MPIALMLAALAAAAETPPCTPNQLVGKWSGTYTCSMGPRTGRADVNIEKKANGFIGKYAITEKAANGQESTVSGTTPLTPTTRKGVYRATVKLDPRNVLKLQSIAVNLSFAPQKDGRCFVFHEADLGNMGAFASLKGNTRIEKKQLTLKSSLASPLANDNCSGRLARVAGE